MSYICYHTKITNTTTNDVYHYFGRHRLTGEEYYGSGTFIKNCRKENDLTPGLWTFNTEIIKEVKTFKEAKHYESLIVTRGIIEYGDKCVNVHPGGDGGVDFHTEETRKQMSISHTGVSRTFSKTHKLNCSLWQRSEVWNYYDELLKIWIELDRPKRGKFSTLLQKQGYNYSANELNKIVKKFNEENNNGNSN